MPEGILLRGIETEIRAESFSHWYGRVRERRFSSRLILCESVGSRVRNGNAHLRAVSVSRLKGNRTLAMLTCSWCLYNATQLHTYNETRKSAQTQWGSHRFYLSSRRVDNKFTRLAFTLAAFRLDTNASSQ